MIAEMGSDLFEGYKADYNNWAKVTAILQNSSKGGFPNFQTHFGDV